MVYKLLQYNTRIILSDELTVTQTLTVPPAETGRWEPLILNKKEQTIKRIRNKTVIVLPTVIHLSTTSAFN